MEYPHRPCPFVDCGSTDAFSFNDETGMFRCFSCGATPKSKRVLVFGISPADIRPFGPSNSFELIEEGISLEPYFRDYRGIKASTLEAHGGYFTKRGEEETVHWQYPDGVTKHRKLPKSITISGSMSKFFGQDEYNAGKTITITEGEEDRLSVIEMMGDYPAVSVPAANPSKDFWINARDYLQNFEKIILSIDNDKPGDKLAEQFFRLFPGKVYRVNHGKYKDANDFLQNGDRQSYKSAWWNAPKVKPDGILSTAEDFTKLYDETPNYEYVATGIPGVDQMMLGLHRGAFTLILAPTGIGKTEFMRYLEHQVLSTSDYSIGICHGEETQLRSLLGLVSYDLGDNLTRKDLAEAKGKESEVRESLERLGRSERVYQFKIGIDDTVDDIVDKVRFLATAMGCAFIFIEPIQDFISGDTSTKESLLTDLSNKLKRMAPEVNVGIVVIAHANEEGDAKYCRSIVQSAAYELVLERDREAEDPYEKNTTRVYVGRKNRTGGGSGLGGSMLFDQDTYMLTPQLGPVEPPTPKRGNQKTETKDKYNDEIPF